MNLIERMQVRLGRAAAPVSVLILSLAFAGVPIGVALVTGAFTRTSARVNACERTCRSLYALMVESTTLGCTCESRDDGRRFLLCQDGNTQRTVLTVPPRR